MNIFILSWIVDECVKWYFDKHVTKMIIETAQLLSTAWWEIHPIYTRQLLRKDIYQSIRNVNHGCAIWARESKANYEWLCSLGLAMCEEYTHRYGKTHKSEKVLRFLQKNIPIEIPDIGLTPVYQAMPDECKHKDPVVAYKRLYVSKYKRHLANWTKREKPLWWE